MTLKIPFKKTLKIGLIAFVIGAVLVFLAFIKLFLGDWSIPTPYVIIGVYVAFCIFLFVIVVINQCYIVEKDRVIVKRLGKNVTYMFKDVIFINKEMSEKDETVTFVTSRGDVRYLTFDTENKLYEIMLKECKNCISEEELRSKYPKIYF